MTLSQANLARLYPETGAGGYSHTDGAMEFFTRINALLAPDMNVIDFGAGRGRLLERTAGTYKQQVVQIRGKVKKLIGIDVDPIVKENPYIDESHVIDVGGALPIEDATCDLVFSDWVLEHVATPQQFADEVFRVLKPGGWFCARTPNRWGMTGIGTNLIPNRFHSKLLGRLQPGRQERDVFPTTYLLNTRRHLRRYFIPSQWEDFSYYHSSEPNYVRTNLVAFALAKMIVRRLPDVMATNLHVFLRKRS